MSDQLEQDQLDFYGRIKADEYFADIPVLLEAKGVTEADIDQALSTLQAVGGKIGVVVIVLMPSLAPDTSEASGPRHIPRLTVQVIDQPLFNLGDSGIGKSCSQVAERVRQICHRFRNGTGGTFTFAGQEPVPVDAGKNSYAVAFTRIGGDASVAKVSMPLASPASGAAPQTVTLTCATPSAVIRYTLDGSYPYAGNAAALIYSTPIAITTAKTLRAAATLTGYQPSDILTAIYT